MTDMKQNQDHDPYVLSELNIKEPPTTWLSRLRYLGPGLILSASIVGSGELIATTTLGAKAGFVTLWVILVSCIIKVALQLEFGRHVINTGESNFAFFKGYTSLINVRVFSHPNIYYTSHLAKSIAM